MQKRYKVMVVDDSAFMRKIISDLISEDGEFEVVATAKNGREAVEKCMSVQPDAITLDLEMPEMDGLEALKRIMTVRPTPVIMLSGETGKGMAATIMALEAGAIDFIRKTSGTISLDMHKEKELLLEKLKIAVHTSVDRAVSSGASVPRSFSRPIVKPVEVMKASGEFKHLVAIGTSTGGPRALQTVLSSLPRDFPAPILIVQHMPPQFTKSLAQRLDQVSSIQVVEASDGEKIQAGTAYIAPGGYHMVLVYDRDRDYRIQLNSHEPISGHRPSVDILFQSLVPFQELNRHIVLMTGMGSDGAKGMKALQEAGALTLIAESEKTAVVYGMPRAAFELGCVTHLLDQENIGVELIRAVHNEE